MYAPPTRSLISAKMVVPSSPRTAVTRIRLHERLRETVDRRLTTLIAPAGWGKTTLLATWAREPSERAVAWLSLDEGDDEPVRFWTYVCSALALVAPEPTREPLAALAGQGLDAVGVALPALLNSLTAVEERYALVLDDYHVLTDPRIHEGVEFLLAYLPQALHLMIAARAAPPLPLARMRVRGELGEIRMSDLRCTRQEAVALLAESSAGVREAAGDLVERTEGWPAGIHLAALALRDSADPRAVIRGEHRHFRDYFLDEVMPDLDKTARDLLVRCSVLERLSGPLCDAVLETHGSAGVLERLERAELFVTAIDPCREWFRCHQLFRDVLRRELDTATPGIAGGLLSRAANWHLGEGQVDDAVRCRIAAGDEEGALELLDARWFVDNGAMADLLHFGEQLAARCAGDPYLCVWLAQAAATSGRPKDDARRWLATAEPLITEAAKPPEGWKTLRAFADAVWSAYITPHDSPTSLLFARRAVELEDDPALWGWIEARLMLAVAERGIGNLDTALAILDQAWQAPSRDQLPTLLELQVAGELMLDLVALGHHDRAREIGAEVVAVAAATECAWGTGASAALARIRLAEARITAAEHGPAAALPALARAVELAEAWAAPNIVVLALTSRAAALWGAGDRAEARAVLARARESVTNDPPRPYAVEELAELELRIGHQSTARARARGMLLDELTDRELAVLQALQGPLTAREIGAELYLSINTIKGYSKSLYRKLGVVTRSDAVARGRELGLI